jgi:acyl transferase domain-containing protein
MKEIHVNKGVLSIMDTSLDEGAIAIIGLAGRSPGARIVDEFWGNIQNGREAITFFTDEQLRAAGVTEAELQHPNYVRASSVLADIEYFDAPHSSAIRRVKRS